MFNLMHIWWTYEWNGWIIRSGSSLMQKLESCFAVAYLTVCVSWPRNSKRAKYPGTSRSQTSGKILLLCVHFRTSSNLCKLPQSIQSVSVCVCVFVGEGVCVCVCFFQSRTRANAQRCHLWAPGSGRDFKARRLRAARISIGAFTCQSNWWGFCAFPLDSRDGLEPSLNFLREQIFFSPFFLYGIK